MLIELILGWEDENLSRAVFLPISLEPEGLSGRNRIIATGRFGQPEPGTSANFEIFRGILPKKAQTSSCGSEWSGEYSMSNMWWLCGS